MKYELTTVTTVEITNIEKFEDDASYEYALKIRTREEQQKIVDICREKRGIVYPHEFDDVKVKSVQTFVNSIPDNEEPTVFRVSYTNANMKPSKIIIKMEFTDGTEKTVVIISDTVSYGLLIDLHKSDAIRVLRNLYGTLTDEVGNPI